MSETIKGGSTGYIAKVDNTNRFWTRSVVEDETTEANKLGNAYNINTGIIDLTDDADTPILYFKNGEAADIHITSIAVGLGPSTNGSGGIPKITVVRNPTTGTIITSTPTNVDVNSNRNFGSAKALSNSLAYKGATGDTMTDGTDHLILYLTTSGRLFATIDEVLPTGSSIGIKIDPQASNTSMEVYAALILHLEPIL